MPELKICGVKSPAFALEAVRRNVNYIGFVFVEDSPRCVSAETAREIASAAKGAKFVGVFAGQGVLKILAIAELVGLDVVQLHGPYSDGDIGELREGSSGRLEIWRLLGDAPGAEDAVLIDGRDGAKTGGTGRRADWSLVSGLKRRGLKVVLAGGLSAENIAEAAGTGADVLDVNSSLETSPGVKSLPLLDDLIARCP